MECIISDHNIPIKLKKVFKKIEGKNTVDYVLYINQSEPTVTILDIPEFHPDIPNIEKELKESILSIFYKYKEKLK
jgi:hypothetical protein